LLLVTVFAVLLCCCPLFPIVAILYVLVGHC